MLTAAASLVVGAAVVVIVAADAEDGCKCARERLPLLRVSDGVLTFAIRLPRSLPRSLLLDIVDDAADDDDACDVCDVCDECDAVESTDEAEFPIEPRVADNRAAIGLSLSLAPEPEFDRPYP